MFILDHLQYNPEIYCKASFWNLAEQTTKNILVPPMQYLQPLPAWLYPQELQIPIMFLVMNRTPKNKDFKNLPCILDVFLQMQQIQASE